MGNVDMQRRCWVKHGFPILLLGHGSHGKDVAADALKHMGITSLGSSRIGGELAVWPVMQDQYLTFEDCYNDRRNHREEWKDLIKAYNTPLHRLAAQIFDKAQVYVGMRDMDEFKATCALFDPLVLYIDASEREGQDPTMEIPISMADIVITNNGTLDEFTWKMARLACALAHHPVKEAGSYAP